MPGATHDSIRFAAGSQELICYFIKSLREIPADTGYYALSSNTSGGSNGTRSGIRSATSATAGSSYGNPAAVTGTKGEAGISDGGAGIGTAAVGNVAAGGGTPAAAIMAGNSNAGTTNADAGGAGGPEQAFL
ncbi:unnamed protein product [Amoebophrya sp. A120]|nr:unnamed protein product [Amoebophrya sp. A120]|eukprot:GSA120T00021331001.1